MGRWGISNSGLIKDRKFVLLYLEGVNFYVLKVDFILLWIFAGSIKGDILVTDGDARCRIVIAQIFLTFLFYKSVGEVSSLSEFVYHFKFVIKF